MMRFIPQISKTILPLLTVLFMLLSFIVGCKETPPPAKPAVVSKRIEQAPKKPAPEKKTASPVKEATPTPAPAPIPVKKETSKAQEMKTETVEADLSTKVETGPEKEAEQQQQTDNEQQSLRSSLPDTSPLYNPVGKIDPFAPLFSEDRGTAESKEAKPKRPLTPLEKIDLSQLQLVAILQTQSGNKAMVEDATGKGYILTQGTFIGINSGKVTDILKDRVVVLEETKDFLGKMVTNTKELKLQKPFGEE